MIREVLLTQVRSLGQIAFHWTCICFITPGSKYYFFKNTVDVFCKTDTEGVAEWSRHSSCKWQEREMLR